MQTKEIQVLESVYKRNEETSAALNRRLTGSGTLCVNVMGAPGVGKTTCLIGVIPLLGLPSAVIEGDIESDIDAVRLTSLGINTVQINTGGACHLDTPQIAAALDGLEPPEGVLFIENIGNLVCPAEFMIGEHVKLLVSSVTEGSDKPYKYPLAFEKADAIVLNKIDLRPYLDFDEEFFLAGVRKLNKTAPVWSVSGRTGAGFEAVAEWLVQRRRTMLG